MSGFWCRILHSDAWVSNLLLRIEGERNLDAMIEEAQQFDEDISVNSCETSLIDSITQRHEEYRRQLVQSYTWTHCGAAQYPGNLVHHFFCSCLLPLALVIAFVDLGAFVEFNRPYPDKEAWVNSMHLGAFVEFNRSYPDKEAFGETQNIFPGFGGN